MVKFVETHIQATLEKYLPAERQFSQTGRNRLSKTLTRKSDINLAKYLFGPKLPYVPLLSNFQVRQLAAGYLAEAAVKAWGDVAVMEPGRLIFITIIDESWVTGDQAIKLDLKRAENKIRCHFRDLRVSHITSLDFQAYDNKKAPTPDSGLWLEPHFHSIAYIEDDSPLFGLAAKEMSELLSGRYKPPIVHPELGKRPPSVVVRFIRPTANDLAYLATYLIKKPDIKVARYDADNRPFNYPIRSPRPLQTVRILEMLTRINFNHTLFASGSGTGVRTEAKRSLINHLRSHSPASTPNMSARRIDRFWNRVHSLDPKLS